MSLGIVGVCTGEAKSARDLRENMIENDGHNSRGTREEVPNKLFPPV